MSRKDLSTRINSKVFSTAMDAWAEKKYGPRFKKAAANIDLAKMLPEPVDKETVRTWRYKRNPAVGSANLECIIRTLGIDVSLKSTEEENVMVLENKPLTVQGHSALEIYRHMFNFLDSVTFDSTADEIEGNFYELQREIESRLAFCSSALQNLIETALDEIILPLLDADTFSAEYTPEIGHDTPDGFHVDNLPLLVQTHEDIMTPYREKLAKLANTILELI